eukprot:TRINITY_DN36997_c1_g1_i1.p1 TRINITY_DN36997_c1_g1~~TRINITY_DN36997_c1_g1_i1.p1  ORF type:complete len:252 (+),score=41.28 TRINITY_DN36997_c1_g1_i1:802-1557(+)
MLIATAVLGARDLVLQAVQKEGMLRFASSKLRSDEEVVLAAVRSDGDSLKFASASLKGNREVVLEAMASTEDALRYAGQHLIETSADLRQFRNTLKQLGGMVAHSVIPLDPVGLPGVDWSHRGMVRALVRRHGGALEHASAALRSDRELVLDAMVVDYSRLRHAAQVLKEDVTMQKLQQRARAISEVVDSVGIIEQFHDTEPFLRTVMAFHVQKRLLQERIWAGLGQFAAGMGHVAAGVAGGLRTLACPVM